MVSEKPLNEIEEEMVSYLLNVDDMNYTTLSMDEIEMQRASYLLNVDDMNYTMLHETLIPGYKSSIVPDLSDIQGLELINNVMTGKEDLRSLELIATQSQIEFPKRKFQRVRPATLEDEIADSSY